MKTINMYSFLFILAISIGLLSCNNNAQKNPNLNTVEEQMGKVHMNKVEPNKTGVLAQASNNKDASLNKTQELDIVKHQTETKAEVKETKIGKVESKELVKVDVPLDKENKDTQKAEEIIKEVKEKAVVEAKVDVVESVKEEAVEMNNASNGSNQTQQQLKDFIKANKDKLAELQKEKQAESVEVAKEATPKVETEVEAVKPVIEEIVSAPSHAIFDDMLKKHVSSDGVVNYSGLKKDESRLDEYLSLLSNQGYNKDWSRMERLAYLINLYNANTIKLILQNFPVKSITDIAGGKPWDKKWIEFNGTSVSLNHIENDIIRPEFNEPRIHFAVNCAAKSCPSLLNEAWTASNLEANLEKQTKKFVNNENFNSIKKSKVELSKIFEWYKADFGDLVTFLNKFSTESASADASISYKEYDWSLNGN